MDPGAPKRWPYTNPYFRAKLLQMQAKYPETEYKKLETELSAAKQKVLWWERQVPNAFGLQTKIDKLEKQVK